MADARKEKFDEAAAWALLKGAASVTVAKGKKVQKFAPASAHKDEVLKHSMGPSGNLRAPTYRVGDDFVVGFNAEMYQEWVK